MLDTFSIKVATLTFNHFFLTNLNNLATNLFIFSDGGLFENSSVSKKKLYDRFLELNNATLKKDFVKQFQSNV